MTPFKRRFRLLQSLNSGADSRRLLPKSFNRRLELPKRRDIPFKHAHQLRPAFDGLLELIKSILVLIQVFGHVFDCSLQALQSTLPGLLCGFDGTNG